MDFNTGYQEMLRRTSPNNINIDKIINLLERAPQGVNKQYVNNNALNRALGNTVKTMEQAIADNKVLDAIAKTPRVGNWGSGIQAVTPLYMAIKSIVKPEDTLGYQIGRDLSDILKGKKSIELFGNEKSNEINNNKPNTVDEEAVDKYLARSAQKQVSQSKQPVTQYSKAEQGLDSIGNLIRAEAGSYQQPTQQILQAPAQITTTSTVPQYTTQQDDIARLLLDKYSQLLGEQQAGKSRALQSYKMQLPLANLSDTLMKAGLAGYARALDNPKLADAYNGSEYSNRLSKTLETDLALNNQLAERINKMNELGGALAVAKNIGVDPSVAMANKDLLKILVDAEKNKMNYDRYIYKANMDLEIANRRNELMKYGYDANNATKLAVADVMARANMYGADTRLLGNYGMWGMAVPQTVVDYMTKGTLPSTGGIQPVVPSGPASVTPTTLQEAEKIIRSKY